MASLLRRAPPYACTALACVLLVVGFMGLMPPGQEWVPAAYAALIVGTEIAGRLYLRRALRKLGGTRCPRCRGVVHAEALKALGWCLRCGSPA